MATSYQTPGVYVEEVARGNKPIEGVGTSVAAFVGFTECAVEPARNGTPATSLLNKATLVTNWSQYMLKFGGFAKGAYLPHAVYGYFANGGGRCYVVSIATLSATDEDGKASSTYALLPSMGDSKNESLKITGKQAAKDGKTVSVVIKHQNQPPGSDGKTENDAFDLVVMLGKNEAERFEGVSLGAGERNVEIAVNTVSKLIQVEMVGRKTGKLAERRPAEGAYALQSREVKTITVSAPEFQGDAARREGIQGLEALDDVTMVCVPDMMSVYQSGALALDGVKAIQTAVLNHCENMKYRFAILDAPPGMSPKEIQDWKTNRAMFDSKYGALYYPWISVPDPFSPSGASMLVPPCGHIAGLYARTDGERGVHKAPANDVLRGVTGLELNVTQGEQAGLNPNGVNCIREFPGRGIRVWGARTLSDDAAWRYINVRRLFNFVEASLERGTQWVVFEPNDQDLWARVRRDVSAFLRQVWRSGALFGSTPEQAFYVKCDEELNPLEVRDSGQLVIEVGLAPVKPAEFVIFRISQWAGPNAEAA
ncbi:MAG: phage tail sheath family protein [Chloroflexi bacterium]|nr:phage tail sheath family protein [Chloroflexota bacterium]